MSRKLYIGNLADDVTRQDLEALFAGAGACDAATVCTDRSGQPRGFGFVEMGSDDEAHQAIQQFDGHELKGRPIKVSEAHARKGSGGDGRRERARRRRARPGPEDAGRH